jgi:hypothetical protein
MQKPEWPGIATAVAIILIFIFGVWLGIADPLWRATWAATS